MIKVGEIIDKIQSLYSKGLKSDDSRLSSRHIYSVAISVRATLISNQINKRQFISDWSYSTIPFLKMVKVSSIECKSFSHLGCDIYRSEKKLPSILTSLDRNIIDWVMKIDNNYIIEPTTRQENLYNTGNRFTSKKLKYVIENQYLYINSSSSPKAISMRYIPTNPIEAYDFNVECVEHDICISNYEKEFLIDRDLVTPLTQIVSQELIEIFSQMREDKTNDSSDNLKQESK